jgi:hypothetical protein
MPVNGGGIPNPYKVLQYRISIGFYCGCQKIIFDGWDSWCGGWFIFTGMKTKRYTKQQNKNL